MKSTLLPLLLFLFSFQAKIWPVQFYACKNERENDFNKECILCTTPEKDTATIVYTKNWRLTLWVNQAYLGRMLLIANRHFGTFEEMNEEELQEFQEIMRTLLPVVKETFQVTHFNVCYLMNQAYRPINPDPPQKEGHPNPHFHWHIIPRYDGPRTFCKEVFTDPDFGNAFNFSRKQIPSQEVLKQAIDSIRKKLNVESS